MMKWIKRLVVYPLLVMMIGIVIFLLFNKDLYNILTGYYGAQLQWFGYEEKGNRIIDKSIKNIKNVEAEIYHGYSVQNTKNGNYDEAIKYLNKAADLDSINVDGYFGWALLYYYRDYDKALFHLERLDNATNYVDYVGDDNIMYAIGLCHKQKGNYSLALEQFKKAIEYESEEYGEKWVNHKLYFQTGRTLHKLNRLLEAISYYNEAINRWDGSSESIYYKGLAEIELGIGTGCDNLEKALVKVQKYIKDSDVYIRLFDEIYIGQVEEMIKLKCNKNNGVEQ